MPMVLYSTGSKKYNKPPEKILIDYCDYENLKDRGLSVSYCWAYDTHRKDKHARVMSVQIYYNGKSTPLARYLLNPPQNLEVDHINRNPLDNRRSNLRVVTHAENMRNLSSNYNKPIPKKRCSHGFPKYYKTLWSYSNTE